MTAPTCRSSLLPIACLLFLVPARTSLACSCACIGLAPFEWSFATADAVFHGTTISVESFAGPEPISRYLRVELEVAAVWKGPVARRLTVVTPEDDFSCGTVFVPGEEYAVYATLGVLIE